MTLRSQSIYLGALLVWASLASNAHAAPPVPPKCYAAELPGDAALVIAIRPSQILGRTPSRGASLIALLHQFDELGGGPGESMRPARLLLDYLGGDWNDVSEIDYVLHSVKLPEPLPPTDPDEAPRRPSRPALQGELIVLQMTEPIDQARARAIMRNVTEILDLGKRYWGRGADGEQKAMYFPDERTVVVGSETMLRRFVQGKKTDGALAAPLAALTTADDVAVLVDLGRFGRSLAQTIPQAQLLADAKSAVITAKFLDTVSAKLAIEAKQRDDAEGFRALFETSIGQLKEELKRGRTMAEPRMPEDEAGREQARLTKSFFSLANRAVENVRLETKGSTFTAEWKHDADLQIAEDYTPLISRNGIAFDPKKAQEERQAKRYRPTDPLVLELQRKLPVAASMANDDLLELASSPVAPKPGMIADQSFTLAIFLERALDLEIAARFPGRIQELRFADDFQPKPAEIAENVSRSSWYGYSTALQLGSIRRIDCQAKDAEATGSVEFEVPQLYRGVVRFSAKKFKAGWEVVEFRLPARGITLHRQAPGDKWQLTTALGKNGQPEKTRRLTGRVTLDGKPYLDGRFEFLFRPTADVFQARTNSAGRFDVSLPPGKHLAVVRYPVQIEAKPRASLDPDVPATPLAPRYAFAEVEVPAEGEVDLKIEARRTQ